MLEHRLLLAAQPDAALNFGQVGSALDSYLTKADQQLRPLLNRTVPFVGGKLGDTATFLSDLAGAIRANVTPATTFDAVRTGLVNAFGPTGLNVLPGGTLPDPTLENTDPSDEDAERVTFALTLHKDLYAASTDSLPFQLGLPGLGFNMQANVDVKLGFTVDLKFVLDKAVSGQFYVDVSKTAATPEMSLDVEVRPHGLADADAELTADLGFLRLRVKDDPAKPSKLAGSIGIDVFDTGAGADGKLTVPEIAALNLTPAFQAGASAQLNLKTIADFGSGAMPSVEADFNLDWALGNATLSSGTSTAGFGSAPNVSINNVKVSLGEFFDKQINPIVREIKKVLEPLDPILDVLGARMPVLSDIGALKDVFDQNNDDKVTLIEAIAHFEPGIPVGFVNAVIKFNEIVQDIPSVGEDAKIDLGGFVLMGSDPQKSLGVDVRSVPNLLGVDLPIDKLLDPLADFNIQIQGQSTETRNFFQGVEDDSFAGGFRFPILQDPEKALQIFLGKDVSLVTLDLPKMEFNFPFEAPPIPILPPLFVTIKGGFGLKLDLAFGFDTFGLRQFANTRNFADIFQGFYVSDTERPDGTGADVPEATMTFTIGAFAELNVVIVRVGVGGGIKAGIEFNLHDRGTPDGKLRAQEIEDNVAENGIFGIFDTKGFLEAGLSAFLKVGIGPFSVETNFDIVSIRLLDFDFARKTSPINPVPAVLDGQGVLHLNIGPRARQRLAEVDDFSVQLFDPKYWQDGDEVITVRQDKDSPAGIQPDGTQSVTVSYLGYTQTYHGVRRIEGDGGDGKDVISILPDVEVPASLTGGAGDDRITVGSGTITVRGGAGDDELAGNGTNSSLFGDDGNDLISGGAGSETIDAGAGDDTVFGNEGNDSIFGGDGVDAIMGGAGDDYVHGGLGNDDLRPEAGNDTALGSDGDDTLRGGSGNDVLLGGIGFDVVTAGSGDDDIDGGADNDWIAAATGNDTIRGGTGNDTVNGEEGADSILGGDGNDLLTGGADNDTISGEAGNDTVFADDGVDSVSGGVGDDELHGGNADDVIAGDDGHDLIYADAGNDSVTGGIGRDTIYGYLGRDTIRGGDDADSIFAEGDADSVYGDGGSDTIDGGSENDTVYGGTEGDSILGGSGNDEIYGEAGADTASGDAGQDRIWGGTENDLLLGGSEADVLRGEAGNDTASGDDGGDLIEGDVGDDSLSGDGGADRIYGGTGNDVIHGHAAGGAGDDGADDTAYGEAGNDQLFGQGGSDLLDGGAGVDTLSGDLGNDVLLAGTGVGDSLLGGDGNDQIVGSDEGANADANFLDATFFGDIIDGGAGDDTIDALGGADSLQGGAGNDSINSGQGSDLVRGGAGNDYLYAGRGSGESLFGDAGNDTVYGSDGGADTISGGDDSDRLFGQGGNDQLAGDAGDDFLDGGAGQDTASGGLGNDEILGGGGNLDSLSGDEGDDVLRGSDDGADLIAGGPGRDRALGNGGNDTITLGAGDDTADGGAGDDSISGDAGADLILGGGGHDVLYGHNPSGAGDDNAVDQIYGDFGTSGNEAGSGRDQIFGQGGNDLLYGEGDDDLINAGGGASNLVNYGAGEGANPGDFVPPGATPPPTSQPQTGITQGGSTLPTGTDYAGRWTQFASSSTGPGVSGSRGVGLEPSVVTDAAGNQYVAWVDSRNGNYEVYVARHVAGSGWQQIAGSASEGGISNTATPSRRPSIALAADGNVMVAWTEFASGGSQIRIVEYDPTANGGQGGWAALGGTASGNAADSAVLMNATSSPVVAYLDSSGGVANVFVKSLSGGVWAGLGGAAFASGLGVSNNAQGVLDFTAAVEGNKVAVAWTPQNANDIGFREFNGSTWAATEQATATPGASRAPSLAYLGGAAYLAWQDDSTGYDEIDAAVRTGTSWTALGNASNTQGAASRPKLASGGGLLHLVWTDDTLANRVGSGVSIYARRYRSGTFVPEIMNDSATVGLAPGAEPDALALAVDAAGKPLLAWGDSTPGRTQVHVRENTYNLTGAVFTADATTSAQSILDANALQPGDAILISGSVGGFTVGPADAGVIIIGLPGATIQGSVTISQAADVTLQRLTLSGDVVVNQAARFTLRESTVGGNVTLSGGTRAQVANNAIGGSVSITGGATDATVEHNTIGQGVSLTAGGASNLTLRDNTISGSVGISLQAASSGTIAQNTIANTTTGIDVAAPFTGTIDHNDVSASGTGVNYAAAAPLSANRIHNNTTGVRANLASTGTAFGWVNPSSGAALPNDIYGNTTGVILAAGRMQNQHVYANDTGVSGSGTLGGDSLDVGNLIELNATGVASFSGPIQFNRIARNATGIAAGSGQFVHHNLVYKNTSVGLLVNGGKSDVRVVNNTFHAVTGDNVRVTGGSSNVQLLNNILWAEAGYDVYVADDSRSGFFSDYNDLYTTGTGKILHWLKDFSDILDVQMDLNLFDLHSIGTTAVNPTWADPRFANKGHDDYRTFGLAAGQRFSSPVLDAAGPFTDLALPAGYQNLLTNPSFDSSLTGWTANPGATTQSANPAPFDGSKYFYSGNIAAGAVEQTVNLAASYTAAQLDSEDFAVVFGGRVRTVDDTGRISLTFLSASDQVISTISVPISNTTDRWELVGDRRQIPVGTRKVRFSFDATRLSGSSNDTYLDSAFVYVISENVAPDQGAYGNVTATDQDAGRPHVAIRSPDLYVDWELSKPHLIRWDSYGNTADTPVRIDLYRDTPDGPEFFRTIAATSPDDGEYLWIPQNTTPAIPLGTLGLRIQVSYVSDNITLDRSSEGFSIPEAGTDYYVDDASNTGDAFTPTATGNNRNTGKSPDAPKPLLTTLLRVYDMGPADTVHVDTGNYQHFTNITLSGNTTLNDDEGVTITGPADTSKIARIDPLGFATGALFDLNDGDFVTLAHLTLGGGLDRGVWLRNSSIDFTGSYLTITGNRQEGVRIESDSTGAMLDHVDVSGSGREGILALGGVASITDGRVHHNAKAGISLPSAGAVVLEGNDVFANASGISIANAGGGLGARVGNANLGAGRGNKVHDNTDAGIEAGGNVAVAGNAVYGNTRGITHTFGGTVTGNVVFDNYDGIRGGVVTNNRVYHNANVGITLGLSIGDTATGNVVYSNGTGISADFPGSYANGPYVSNNLVYANTQRGLYILGGKNGTIVNNTVYQPVGDAIRVEANPGTINLQIRNNILAAGRDYALNVALNSQPGIVADYNDYYTFGTGKVGFWSGAARNTLTAWRQASQQDGNSLAVDPRFVDVDGADNVLGYTTSDGGADDDFHLRSTSGSFHGGSPAPVLDATTGLPVAAGGGFTLDGENSSLIDRGDPATPYNNEPSPNGGFVNIGADGNTPHASKSLTPYVTVTLPGGGEIRPIGQTVDILWRSQDTLGTVDVELWRQGGGAPVLVIADDTANDGTYLWTVPAGLTTAGDYFVRVTRPGPVSGDSAAFSIIPRSTQYYVNDGTVAAGDLTSAAGNDANDGLTPATPKASIRALLDAYDLGAGDVINVDYGTYVLTGNIVITNQDSGVRISGPSTGPLPILNRNNTAGGNYVFDLQNADDVTIEFLKITGADRGLNAAANADSDNLTFRRNDVYGNSGYGVFVDVTNDNALITQNDVHDHQVVGFFTGTGILVNGDGGAVSANTVHHNRNIGIDGTGGGAFTPLNVTLSGNDVYNNRIGINVSADSQVGGGYTVSGNQVHDNADADIALFSRSRNTVAVENQVYGAPTGIRVTGFAEAKNNTVYGHTTGIAADSSFVTGNRVFNNTGAGISTSFDATLFGNRVYSNAGGGISGNRASNAAGAGPYYRNNLVYANAGFGIQLVGGRDAVVENNTVYQPAGDALRMIGGAFRNRVANNVLVASGAGAFAYVLTSNAIPSMVSDYNDVVATGGAKFGKVDSRAFLTRDDWLNELRFDTHSITADPQFIDPDGADDLLGYTAGADYGLDDDFHVRATSPTVDAGDPDSVLAGEPQPSGGRINLGNYGNTREAAASPAQTVQVLLPNGLERFDAGATYPIGWRSAGLTPTAYVAQLNMGGAKVGDFKVNPFTLDAPNTGSVSTAIDTSGVTNAPPQQVYQSYQFANNGVGNRIAYDLPVADGTYTLRLHWQEAFVAAGQRLFDIKVNGVVVQANVDVRALAGAFYKAVALSIPVTVSGGTGILLELVNKTGNPAFLCGLEITATNPAGVANPTVNLDYSTDGGQSWSPIAGNLPMDVLGRGTFNWTVPNTPSSNALIRVRANNGSQPTDVSDGPFSINAVTHGFYVNDSSTVGDTLTTATGDNANSGRSPDAPMASLAAILAAYDFGPGDVIHVDAGTYSLINTLFLDPQDSGVTIQGPTAAGAAAAVLNRGNAGSSVIYLAGADDVTLDRLAITGGYIGIESQYDSSGQSPISDRVVLSNLDVYGNSYYGIFLNADHQAVTLRDSRVHHNDGGVSISATNALIADNTINNHRIIGLAVNATGTVSGNNVFANTNAGVTASVRSGAAFGALTLAGNQVHDNAFGISAAYGVSVTNNQVYGNTLTAQGFGIESGGGTVEGNTVYGNFAGIRMSSGVVRNNRVYANSGVGITTTSNGVSTITGNTVYNNPTGIAAGGTVTVAGNLVYNAATAAISVGDAPTVLGNTVYQPAAGDGIRVGAASFGSVRNNIVWVAQGIALTVASGSTFNFTSDYNDLFAATLLAKVGRVGTTDYATRAAWNQQFGFDAHSISADPQFADPDGADDLLGYVGGVDRGGDDDFHLLATSPGIDAGDPASPSFNEPTPNGLRVNLGHEGNTPGATPSAAQVVQVLSPNGFDKVSAGKPYTITWRVAGLAQSQSIALFNVGGPLTGSWDATPEAYVVGPVTYGSYPGAVDTSGVSDPAPAPVYQTFAFAPNGVGNKLAFRFPVRGGAYALRLHFQELYVGAGQRKFDVRINGVTVLTDYDVNAAAGGFQKAVAVTVSGNVTGGNGLLLELVNKTANPAELSGVQIIANDPAAPAANPTVNVQLSTDNGATWTTIATDRPMDLYGRGSFVWTPTVAQATAGNTALIRVVAIQGSQPSDTSDSPFVITAGGKHYYVNDASTVGDTLTTAPGDNANSGMTPDKPMASLDALLAAYDLGPGDVVHVDNGTYVLVRNVQIRPDDSGVTIQGPSSGRALFDRQDTGDGNYAFDFVGADDVTIERLAITNVYAAFRLDYNADSDRITIRGNEVSNIYAYGVYAGTSNDNLGVLNNRIHDFVGGNFSYGVNITLASGSAATVSGNTVYNVPRAGISLYGGAAGGSAITGNSVYGTGTAVQTDSAAVSGNTIRNNTTGLVVEGTAAAVGNTVFTNTTGIDGTVTIADNRVYNNTTGIHARGGAIVRGNRAYGNSVGIHADSGFSGRLFNNLVYQNSNLGISVPNAASPQILNNTVYQTVGDAVRIQNSSTGVTLRNNILWVEAGADVYVAADSQTGFSSDYNVLYRGAGGAASVGNWAGVVRGQLADWQSATGQDAHSTAANPLFVDPDGPDNVLGYASAGNGYDGGGDDNFYLRKTSAAIDSGESWLAPLTDLEGRPASDDPGTPNSGSPNYVPTVAAPTPFALTGTAQNYHSQPGGFALTINLPFTFSFYGQNFTSLAAGANGVLRFGAVPSGQSDLATDGTNAADKLTTYRTPILAALWDNLSTVGAGNDIFVEHNTASAVKWTRIRWRAIHQQSGAAVNFAIVLYSDGTFRFEYGGGNTGLSPTVGLAGGNGLTSTLLPGYDGAATLADAPAVNWSTAAGFRDRGALEFGGSTSDRVGPSVVATDPVAGSTVTRNQITVTFSEPLNAVDAGSPANYELRWAGPDGVFGSADDTLIAVAPTYASNSNLVMLGLSQYLSPGSYRLTLYAAGPAGQTLRDLAGNPLAADSVTTFLVRPPTVVNAPTAFVYDPAPHRLAFRFNTDVSGTISADDLVLTGPAGAVAADRLTFAYDAATFTATWSFVGGFLPDGNYRATLRAAGITDRGGAQLDGNGDGVVGDDFSLDFFELLGDANRDRVVNFTDLLALAKSYNQTGKTLAQGDFDGNGTVNFADLLALAKNYNKGLPAPSSAAVAASSNLVSVGASVVPALSDVLAHASGTAPATKSAAASGPSKAPVGAKPATSNAAAPKPRLVPPKAVKKPEVATTSARAKVAVAVPAPFSTKKITPAKQRSELLS